MKGIVFTEFLDFVVEQFSLEMMDNIIEASVLPSGGAYTAVGTYDYQEMMQLVSALGKTSGLPVTNLVVSFGQHLFGVFVKKHPEYIEGIDSTFSFLLAVEKTIHAEVLKLYPDAELPRFKYEFPDPNKMMIKYQSRRALGDLAEGLMLGCIDHFGESITIQRQNMPPGDGTTVHFLLTRGQ